jgi:uncharacterized membrane protein YbhN (UPF0104 family)
LVGLLTISAAAATVALVPGLGGLRERVANADPAWVVVAALAQLASTLSFTVALRGALGRRIGWSSAFQLSMVEQAGNVLLPTGGTAGLAVGAGIAARAGLPSHLVMSRTTVLFVVTSAVSFVALIAAGAAQGLGLGAAHVSGALGWLPAAGGAALATGALLLIRIGTVRPLPRAHGRWGRLAASASSLVQGLALGVEALRRPQPLLLLGSLGYFAFDVCSLVAGIHAVGGDAPPAAGFVVAYVLGHAGAMVPLPGSAEGGLITCLTAYGLPLTPAVGGVMIYRAFHAGIPVVLGLMASGNLMAGLRQDAQRAPAGACCQRRRETGQPRRDRCARPTRCQISGAAR